MLKYDLPLRGKDELYIIAPKSDYAILKRWSRFNYIPLIFPFIHFWKKLFLILQRLWIHVRFYGSANELIKDYFYSEYCFLMSSIHHPLSRVSFRISLWVFVGVWEFKNALALKLWITDIFKAKKNHLMYKIF